MVCTITVLVNTLILLADEAKTAQLKATSPAHVSMPISVGWSMNGLSRSSVMHLSQPRGIRSL